MIETNLIKINTENDIKEFEIYYNTSVKSKAYIIYIHGGGLIYGSKSDLPDFHIEKLTSAGYKIICLDYPLAPNKTIDFILDDLVDSINRIVTNPNNFGNDDLEYFIWGRSAGAYLGLLAVSKYDLKKSPAGLISYYGYGFFDNDWDKIPSKYYNTFPKVSIKDLPISDENTDLSASLEDKYHLYVYARQNGNWSSMFYEGREKYFYRDYSLRTVPNFSMPIFACHAINDTDVPFSEFNKIKSTYKVDSFIAPVDVHDFDRDVSSPFTKKLLDKTIKFLDTNL